MIKPILFGFVHQCLNELSYEIAKRNVFHNPYSEIEPLNIVRASLAAPCYILRQLPAYD
jgi:hypothetical protein